MFAGTESGSTMRLFISILFLVFISAKVIILSGCANIIPPTGGPRDSLPPVLVSAIPENNDLLFTGNRITFTFDEYVELKETQANVVVSPFPKTAPIIESKLKVVSVKLKDTLEPNTTYTINFGNSIHDINEGNILKNFSYTFSTGSWIDSMEFSGLVKVASNGKVDSTMIVMLHRNLDDSAVAKERPRYITHIDTGGHFHFVHLRPGTYAVYALKDDAGTRKYTSKTALFAFADSPIVISSHTPPISLFAFADTSHDNSKNKAPAAAPQTQTPKKQDKDKVKRLTFSTNLSTNQLDLQANLEIRFDVPLRKFDSAGIKLTDDKFNDLHSTQFILDSLKKKMTVITSWKPGSKYNLIAAKEFAEDTLSQKLLKADTLAFQTKSESDYGSLRIRFSNLNLSKNPVLLFVQSDAIKMSRPLNSRTFYEKLVQPGEYELRILYDDNKNGAWDPGEFFKQHRQPEKVIPVRTKFNVRANWDNETDISL